MTALLALPLAAGSARAADMSLPPLYQPDPAPMVEFGSGWYLRGDVGYSSLGLPAAGAAPFTNGVTPALGGQSLFGDKLSHLGTMGASVGVGYQFNNWLRADVTYDWRPPQRLKITTTNGLSCLLDVTNPTGTVTLTNTGSCYKVDTASETSWTGLANLYADLGHWHGITPYVGGGVGLTNLHANGTENWFWDNGSAYGDGQNNYTSKATGVTYHYGYPGNIGPKQDVTNFSWAAMAGVSYDITQHVKFDVGYRYLHMGYLAATTTTGAETHKSIDSQEVRGGLRFTPDL
jgi:opacity protein-like surface antigen